MVLQDAWRLQNWEFPALLDHWESPLGRSLRRQSHQELYQTSKWRSCTEPHQSEISLKNPNQIQVPLLQLPRRGLGTFSSYFLFHQKGEIAISLKETFLGGRWQVKGQYWGPCSPSCGVNSGIPGIPETKPLVPSVLTVYLICVYLIWMSLQTLPTQSTFLINTK